MENAAEALKMAFGVILALLLISLVIYVFNIMGNSEDQQAEQKVIKETQEFNKKFLAYDKTLMYGTDLISILGLAITNNTTCNQSYEMNPNGMFYSTRDGSMNVVFELKEELNTVKRTYTRISTSHSWETPTIEPTRLLSVGKYSLDNTKYTSNSDIYDKIYAIAINGDKTTTIYESKLKRIEEDTTGFNELKKRVFQCTDVRYDGVGRINEMHFTEVRND